MNIWDVYADRLERLLAERSLIDAAKAADDTARTPRLDPVEDTDR